VYIGLSILVVLLCNFIVYRVSFYLGIRISTDFMVDELENNGYIVEFREDHKIVTPKYSIEWYKQRRQKVLNLGAKYDNEHEH